jgi:hypothetical protein
MGLIASCPRCGLSMQVLDLGIGGPPRCPTCEVPLEELPEAEAIGEPAPEETPALPPLTPTWLHVQQGLHLMHRTLLLLFACWGLLLVAAAANLVFRLADREKADSLFLYLPLAASAVAVGVTAYSLPGRRACSRLDEPTSPAPKRACDSARAAVLAGVLWLIPPLLLLLGLLVPIPTLLLVIAWAAALLCSAVSEVLFLLFLREVGRSLADRPTQNHVKHFFRGLALLLAGLVAVSVIVSLLNVMLPDEGAGPTIFGILLFLLVALLGVGSSALLARYLLAVLAARRALEQRLPAP